MLLSVAAHMAIYFNGGMGEFKRSTMIFADIIMTGQIWSTNPPLTYPSQGPYDQVLLTIGSPQ